MLHTDFRQVVYMAALIGKTKLGGVKEGLYHWGIAELTDKWVILYKHGNAKWAISYRRESPAIAKPFRPRNSPRKGVVGRGKPRRKTNT